jgi:hypothetical protein
MARTLADDFISAPFSSFDNSDFARAGFRQGWGNRSRGAETQEGDNRLEAALAVEKTFSVLPRHPRPWVDSKTKSCVHKGRA